MDVSFWGPSGWQLFHLISMTIGGLKEKKELFSTLDEVLPCKYCRQSAKEFLEDPPSNNIALWLYEFHDKVNNKLHQQHLENPKSQNPKSQNQRSQNLKKNLQKRSLLQRRKSLQRRNLHLKKAE